MPKTTRTYWNPLSPEHHHDWQPIEGRLYDAAFDRWLEKGDYASRPPGEVRGRFRTDEGCLVLEISYPSRSAGS